MNQETGNKRDLMLRIQGKNAGNVVNRGGNVAGFRGVYLLVDLSQFFEGGIQIFTDHIAVN